MSAGLKQQWHTWWKMPLRFAVYFLVSASVLGGEKVHFSEPRTRSSITQRPEPRSEPLFSIPSTDRGSGQSLIPSPVISQNRSSSDRQPEASRDQDWIFRDTSTLESLREALGVRSDFTQDFDPKADPLERSPSNNRSIESSLTGSRLEQTGLLSRKLPNIQSSGLLDSQNFLSGQSLNRGLPNLPANNNSQQVLLNGTINLSNPALRNHLVERLSYQPPKPAFEQSQGLTAVSSRNPDPAPQTELERLMTLEAMRLPETPAISENQNRLTSTKTSQGAPINNNRVSQEFLKLQENRSRRHTFPTRSF